MCMCILKVEARGRIQSGKKLGLTDLSATIFNGEDLGLQCGDYKPGELVEADSIPMGQVGK